MTYDLYKNKGLSIFEFAFIAYSVLYLLVPGVERSFNYTYFALIEAIYIFIIINIEKKRKIRKIIAWFWGVSLFIGIAYAILQDPVSISGDKRELKMFFSTYYSYSNFFFPILFLYRTLKYATRFQVRWILMVAFVGVLFWSYDILNILETNPLAGRSFGHGQSEIYDDNWIAPFYFVYAMTVMTLLSMFFAKYSKVDHNLGFYAILFTIYWWFFLIKVQFTLSVITTFLSFLYMLYANARTKAEKHFMMLGGFVTIMCVPTILIVLMDFLPDSLMSRMSEIVSLSEGKEMNTENSDMMVRFDLYLKSLIAFFHSPIWGNRVLDFDGHASGLFILAQVGIIGSYPIYKGWFRAYKTVTKLMEELGPLYKPFYLLFLINIFTNPIHASIPTGVSLNCFAPLAIIYFKNYLNLNK